MDFWSRLIAATSLAPADKTPSNNPEKRLARFKKEYNQLLSQLKHQATNLFKDNTAAETVKASLQLLTTILSDESRRPLPHPCIAFAASEKIYAQIEKIASFSSNEGIIREGVAIFATLIESEEEDFVQNNVFAQSLMRLLVRITGANSLRIGSETEAEIVELSFNITTKIRLDPEILPAWFSSQPRAKDSGQGLGHVEAFAGKTHREDFPLFYLLIDYIHHEGRIGDFARTGLLYIIEAAANSAALEQWIVESDLATLMATGLGALYSQLSRKLVIDHPDGELPAVLALSDYQRPLSTPEIVSSSSPDFQMHMETFLSHLVFWQDVLNHCKSIEVKQTLLEHFRVIFLQQLLYPSLLESSDLDGGSSVAVLTYLRRILEVLDHPDMIHLILHYLLALPDTTPSPANTRIAISAARKRKSIDLATLMASHAELESTPALFNLIDLIHGSLKSPSRETISVTLQLVSVILRRHHKFAVSTLLRTSLVMYEGPQRTIGAQDRIIQFLFDLVENIDVDGDLDETYENHLKDCMSTIENHPCSMKIICPKPNGGGAIKFPSSHATIPGAPREIRIHTLRPDDPMLQIMIGILDNFILNSIETNLSLTATITDLATCGFMRIDGWLLPDKSNYIYEQVQGPDLTENSSEKDDLNSFEACEKNHIRALKLAHRIPKLNDSQLPSLLMTLKKIVGQVAFYRERIPRFDELLQQRREAFHVASSTESASNTVRQPQPQVKTESVTGRMSRPNAFDTFTQRFLTEIGTPSRPKSPRSHKKRERLSGFAGGFGFVSLNGSRSASNPSNSPTVLDLPFSGSSQPISTNPNDGGDSAIAKNETLANQATAFEGMDQRIMSKKISLPPIVGHTASKPFIEMELENKEVSGVASRSTIVSTDIGGEEKMEVNLVSINHILTNVIILQEFLLELAALIQVRATLFGEVGYI
ncbi:hypothetical protein BGHDH14_bgh03049 [Blumeria hordei DH14]|uniref:DNA polymerase epsilon subunit C n=1 Tax=Blumeria graminis f. sp. hordei (strain DH14) TaxID=546991 RepID=N1JEI3_BLUG1|nr:hypothetical protein BGHDH14_bgh03049 [Blumeria hordei DH14]